MRSAWLVSAILVAGCSGSGEPADQANSGTQARAAPASSASACSVLTLADAKAALGRDDVRQLDAASGPANLDLCQYGYQGERLADAGNVSVTVQPVDFASVIAGAAAGGYTLEPVPGLGDDAAYSPDIGLYVGKGNRTAIYLLAATGMTDARERSIRLARSTLARL